jgi:hypothetical protein
MATMSFAEVRTLVVKINTPKTQPGVPIGWKVGTTYQVKVTVTTGSAFVTNAKVFVQFGGPDLVYMKHVGNGVYETTWIPQVPTARISQAAVRAERTDPNAKDEHSRLQYGADWFLYEVKK